MNSEQEFRNKLDELLGEQHYSYEAFNWEKASKELDKADEKRRRVFFFWILSGSGILAAFLLWYYIGTVEQQNTMVAVKENSEVTQQKPQRELNSETISATEKQEEPKPETKQVTNEAAKLKKTSVSSVSPENTTKPEKATLAKEPEQIKPEKEVGTTKPLKPLEAYTKTPASNNGKNNVVTIPGKIVPSETLTATLKTEEKIREEKASTMDKEASTNVRHTSTIPSAGSGQVLSVIQDKPLSPTAKGEDKKILEEKTIALEKPVKDSVRNQEAAPAENLKPVAIPEKPTVNESVAAKKDSVIPKDSLITTAKNKINADSTKSIAQPTLQVSPPLNYFYAEAGTYLNIGWNVDGKHEGLGFNPYFGLSYVFQLSDKTSVTLGGYYYTINRLKSSKTIKSTEVVFGEVSDVTEITPTRLNYIAIPIRFQYNLSDKEILTAGASFAYLLDVQSRVRTYHEAYNIEENVSTHWTGGYREGIRTFNNQISVGYRRKLYQNLWANAEFLFGLSDIRDNSFFGINKKELAHGFKLSLTYNLIKK